MARELHRAGYAVTAHVPTTVNIIRYETALTINPQELAMMRNNRRTRPARSSKAAPNSQATRRGKPLRRPLNVPYQPTPEDIEAACARIREGWRESERRQRAGLSPVPRAIVPMQLTPGVLDGRR